MALPFYIYNKQKYGDICQRQTNKCHSAKSRAAADTFTIKANFTNTDVVTCEIYALNGEMLFADKLIFYSNLSKLNLNLASGMYNLKLISKAGVNVQKIVLTK